MNTVLDYRALVPCGVGDDAGLGPEMAFPNGTIRLDRGLRSRDTLRIAVRTRIVQSTQGARATMRIRANDLKGPVLAVLNALTSSGPEFNHVLEIEVQAGPSCHVRLTGEAREIPIDLRGVRCLVATAEWAAFQRPNVIELHRLLVERGP